MILKIEDNEYSLKFGYGALKKLGMRWNLSGIDGVMLHLSKLFPDTKAQKQASGLDFDQIDTLSEMIYAAIENAEGTCPLDTDSISQYILQNIDVVVVVAKGFIASFPQKEPAGERLGK